LFVIARATSARGQDSSVVVWLFKAATNASTPKPTIVLVHGASENAMSWQYLIPILKKDGYRVIAVENPLSSLAEDIATTERVIHEQQGPVVVVGHSYGGAVITGAAAGNLNVKALVYLAGFAPDANEPVLGQTISFPAWRTIRSWYLVSRDDPAIDQDQQRFLAKRMRAATSEMQGSHVTFTSQPKTIAQFIEVAAVATRK